MNKVSSFSVNLSGTWRLNQGESFLGNEHPKPDYELTWILEQSQRDVRIHEIANNLSIVNIPLPDTSETMEYTPDRREREVTRPGLFPGMPERRLGTKAEWQADTFWIEERSYPNTSNSITHRRIFLAEGGTKLIELRETNALFGDTAQRLVFERIP
jgi:hypothetical protein